VTALHLNRLGIDAVVFEVSSEVRALGVEINLLPHAVRELTILGLADRIPAAAVATEELVYFNKFGAEIWREPRGVAAGVALELENLALRHQIGILKRSGSKRPKLTAADRLFWVSLSRVWCDWRSALNIVKPATVIAWHR
jgi:hypothetical protein